VVGCVNDTEHSGYINVEIIPNNWESINFSIRNTFHGDSYRRMKWEHYR